MRFSNPKKQRSFGSSLPYQESPSKLRKKRAYFVFELDRAFATLFLIFITVSTIVVYSASYGFSVNHQNENILFQKHLLGISLSLFIFFIVSILPLSFWKKGALVFYRISLFTLILSFIPWFSYSANGNNRWVSLYFFTFQPSEFAKAGILFFLSHFLSKHQNKNWSWMDVFKILYPILTVIFLIYLEGNLSTSILFFTIAMLILFVSKVPNKYLFSLVIASLFWVIPSILMVPYRVERVKSLLSIFSSENQNSGYQILQSIRAIHQGSFLGQGPGNGSIKIPYGFNDFIFASSVQDFGFFGGMAILTLYIILFILGIRLFRSLHSVSFESYMVLGITLFFTYQSLLHIGVNIGLIFPTGVNLPLISYGSSSYIVFSFFIGFLSKISAIRIKSKETEWNPIFSSQNPHRDLDSPLMSSTHLEKELI